MRDVLGIAQANRHTADRIAAALLAPDPRFGRTTDGRWTVATPPSSASPVLESCRWAVVDVETTGVLRAAPTFDAIVDRLLAALEGCVFVAHNARFDWAFVSTEIERATGLLLQGPRVCTVRLARKLLPDLPRRNLDTVSYHFGIEIEGRHRATGDAVAAAKCLAQMLKLAQGNGAATLGDLHNL